MDHFVASSVVIQHHNSLGHIKQFFTFCIAWLVGINNNYHCIIIYKFHCLIMVYEHRRFIIRIVHISCHQRTNGSRWIIYHNMDRLTKSLTCTINTNSSSQRIHICDLVSHDYHTFFGTHEFFQRLCLHPGFYSGGFFHLLCFAAKIGDTVTVLNYHLVTATSQCHLNGNPGIFIILKISGRIQSNTDT